MNASSGFWGTEWTINTVWRITRSEFDKSYSNLHVNLSSQGEFRVRIQLNPVFSAFLFRPFLPTVSANRLRGLDLIRSHDRQSSSTR